MEDKDTSQDNLDFDAKPQGKRRGPWPMMVAVVVLTLVAIWLVPDKTQTPPGTDPGAQLAKVPPTDIRRAQPRQQLALPTEPTGAGRPIESDRPGDAARRLIADLSGSEDAASQAFAAAQQYSAKGRDSDAYLLYFFAARAGHADAAMTLGRQSDPAFHDQATSFPEPDVVQAHKWYRIAEAAGSDEARRQLADLRGRVEANAAEGDAGAKRLMLQWR